MTPDALGRLHTRAMQVPGPWSARDFEQFLATPGVFLVTEAQGFALGRATLDEAELLTLAVDPDHQRGGIGARLLRGFEQGAENRGATQAFLEVAANNTAAKALYAKAGWTVDGLRKGYYRAKPAAIDAVTMSKALKSR
jgi:ribosomal-protein-alanine N-acetyltransferase